MTRWTRVGRGASVAAFATLIAAVSHMLAGGNTPTLLALTVTFVLGAPLGVALAGVRLSLPRLVIGVSLIQALFHACFSLVGVSTAPAGSGTPALPAHAQHQQAFAELIRSGTSLPSAQITGILPDALMMLWHAFAAVLTIALLRRGERAAHALSAFVWTALTALWHIRRGAPRPELPHSVLLPALPIVRALASRHTRAISGRGPPALAYSHAPRISA